MTFVASQEYSGPEMTAEFAAACEEDMYVLCADGTVRRGGRGILFILGEIGWPRTARWLLRPPMIWIVNIVYSLVASNRRFFSRILFRKPPVP